VIDNGLEFGFDFVVGSFVEDSCNGWWMSFGFRMVFLVVYFQ